MQTRSAKITAIAAATRLVVNVINDARSRGYNALYEKKSSVDKLLNVQKSPYRVNNRPATKRTTQNLFHLNVL